MCDHTGADGWFILLKEGAARLIFGSSGILCEPLFSVLSYCALPLPQRFYRTQQYWIVSSDTPQDRYGCMV